jgi:hypothetical protein
MPLQNQTTQRPELLSLTIEEQHSVYLWRLLFTPFRHASHFTDGDWRDVGRFMVLYARRQGWT